MTETEEAVANAQESLSDATSFLAAFGRPKHRRVVDDCTVALMLAVRADEKAKCIAAVQDVSPVFIETASAMLAVVEAIQNA